jgi:hypothetical protein
VGTEEQPKEQEKEEETTVQEREEVVDKEEEENKNKLTLQEYLAQKKTVGLRKEARKPEEVKKAGIEKVEKQADKTTSINNQLKERDLYATSKQEGADLLGF